MSERGGDSRHDRESLDRHITGNREDVIPIQELQSSEMDYDCMDALADIWQDCYRRGNPGVQRALFLERINPLLRSATGQPIKAG